MPEPWDPVPVPPDQAAARIQGIPLLVVHGDQDPYFPVEHAQQIFQAAQEPKELWLLPGYGHAETACRPELTDRIGRWAAAAAGAQTAQVLARAAEAEAEAASTSVTGPPPAQETESKAHTAVEAAGATGLPPAAG
jgi:dienelactone hydrolase